MPTRRGWTRATAGCTRPTTVYFTRCGLKFRAVEADTGNIGGSFSHEFMVLADTGEDAVIFCTNFDYAANLEKAEVARPEKIEIDTAQNCFRWKRSIPLT